MARRVPALRAAIAEFSGPLPPTPIINDNASAVFVSHDAGKLRTEKPIDIRYHFVKGLIAHRYAQTYLCRGSQLPADIGTKSTSRAVHHRLRDCLMTRNADDVNPDDRIVFPEHSDPGEGNDQ